MVREQQMKTRVPEKTHLRVRPTKLTVRSSLAALVDMPNDDVSPAARLGVLIPQRKATP
jgi:hypothetical protein